MPDEAEYQPQNSIFQPLLLPDTLSSVVLSGGRTIPHHYYLGPNNTVTFIRLENPASSMEISWGELITVRPGQQVAVRNVSKMPGDLQIQSGTVPAPQPPRITVPVRIKNLDQSITNVQSVEFRPEFPCDTRRARRAWFALGQWGELYHPSFPADISFSMHTTVLHYFEQHSCQHQTYIPYNSPDKWAFSNYQWGDTMADSVNMPDNFRMIPLGSSQANNAMRLGDYAWPTFQFSANQDFFAWELLNDTACYVLEY